MSRTIKVTVRLDKSRFKLPEKFHFDDGTIFKLNRASHGDYYLVPQSLSHEFLRQHSFITIYSAKIGIRSKERVSIPVAKEVLQKLRLSKDLGLELRPEGWIMLCQPCQLSLDLHSPAQPQQGYVSQNAR